MIYFFAYKNHHNKWKIKCGFADDVRSRLTSHRAVYHDGMFLMGLMPGNKQWETYILGKFSYLGSSSSGGNADEHLTPTPAFLEWIYENTSLTDYKHLIPRKMKLFPWKRYIPLKTPEVIYLPATLEELRLMKAS